MPTVRLTDTAWQTRETDRVKGVLLMNLTRQGMDQAELLKFLQGMGFEFTPAEWQSLGAALVAQGIITIVP